ncbi:MAG: hydrogenase formation protein HypD [Hahellaceae bacterium]|nr:hydrogenase formation protein HypD [Hahellaceae bacterium]MCP5169266.1 hydrogenase formation protein HypD [Hahellaceae bacterium]
MNYLDEFRDGALGQKLLHRIQQAVRPEKSYRFMEFCGGHTHALFRYGIPDLLPANVSMIHGPGCPVCVLPMARVDQAIALARLPGVILCSYGDMLRVPGARGVSLLKARAEGADVRMVYAVSDAVALAQQFPDRDVIFFAIGFETTTPPTALALQQARALGLTNFSVFCNHVLTPPAMEAILSGIPAAEPGLDGLVGPAHVSTVVGTAPYVPIAQRWHLPIVVAGFEPLDVLQALLQLIIQVNEGRAEVENQYTRAVRPNGNPKAQQVVNEVFEIRSQFEWRGLGGLADSALKIRDIFSPWDAEKRFKTTIPRGKENPACDCPDVLRGMKSPKDCKLFGAPCTPDHPMGACMVSSEGACAAHYRYRSET